MSDDDDRYNCEPPVTVESLTRIRLHALPSYVCEPGAHGWIGKPAHLHVSQHAAREVLDGQWLIVASDATVHLLATIWEEGMKL
jgi:hypothetical protein